MGVQEPGSSEFYVDRNVLNEISLDEVARKRTFSIKPPLKERVKDSLRCSVPKLKRSVLGFLPVLSWLPRYSLRDNALGDLTSGISVGIMHLPMGLAYSLLAGTPPVYGLYTSFYPVLVYIIFGTSKHISMGTFAVTSLMVGTVTQTLAPNSNYMTLNGTNGTAVLDSTALYNDRVQIASSLTVLCGIFQFAMGLLQVGFIATYLSDPLVRGYTTGAGIQVVLSQLSSTFGISTSLYTGPLSQVYLLIDVCRHLPMTNIGAVVITLVSLVVLITVKELNTCYAKKLPAPIPIELIVIIVGTIISYYANLNGLYKVAVVGQIPRGLLAPRNPDISLWGSVAGSAFALAIVGYAISISLGKTFGLKHGYKVDSNQELIALGACNLVGGFFQCHFVTPALSRSLLQETTGGKTQMVGLVSSVFMLIIILEIGTLFQQLPKAVLACIVYVNLKGIFVQFWDIPALWKSNKVDLMVWLVTLVCTILLNLDMGLAVAVAFSIITVIVRSQLPNYYILGRVPGTEIYLDIDAYEEVKEIPGVIIFRSSTTMYYTNAELYLDALQKKSGIDTGKLITQKKKREAEEKRQAKTEENKAKKEAKKLKRLNGHLPNGTVHPEDDIDLQKASQDLKGNQLSIILTDRANNGQVNWAFEKSSEAGFPGDDLKTQKSSTNGDGEMGSSHNKHTLILDLSTASFVDTVTLKTLRNIFKDFKEIGIATYLTGCQVCVVEQLSIAGFFCESIPKSCLFATVHDAVLHSLRVHGDKDIILYDYALDTVNTKM
ncbi:solute carrier family 26 member 6-like isoform X1 [Esox lucius]|uniref:STAS domain-containing protein n=1 Tax=Esox lucius TaxID=8010 RepID=A0AAY5KGP8_ESOLU|nr:solute carrier family 26 member 6-like isoform X1 [Esox lucius]